MQTPSTPPADGGSPLPSQPSADVLTDEEGNTLTDESGDPLLLD